LCRFNKILHKESGSPELCKKQHHQLLVYWDAPRFMKGAGSTVWEGHGNMKGKGMEISGTAMAAMYSAQLMHIKSNQ
jgi:hypothetical protein